MSRLVLAMLITTLLSAAASAADYRQSSVFSDFLPDSASQKTSAGPPAEARARVMQLKPSLTLAPAAVAAQAELKALTSHNRALRGGDPETAGAPGKPRARAVQNGFERRLPQPLKVTIGAGLFSESVQPGDSASATGNFPADQFHAEKIVVESAGQLRLRLANVQLEPGAELWVSSENGKLTGPFGNELIDIHGDLWTPSVFGESITLLVVAGPQGGGASLEMVSVLEIFALDGQQRPQLGPRPQAAPPGCQEDAACYDAGDFSAIDQARSAVGSIIFQSGGDSFVCTGGLINDTNPESFVPLFLTANHCLSSGPEATSAEVFWDNFRPSCNGSAPGLGSRPRSNGASLLATGVTGDYTLLELNSVPGGRWFLGWDNNAAAVQAGTTLHRLSSPGGDPQVYSRSVVNGSPQFLCQGLSQTNYLYQTQLLGGTDGGSSGSPVMLDTGQVVGQLFGDCGDNVEDACDYSNLTIDGKLASFFPAIAPWLDPQEGATPADLTISTVRAERGSFAPGRIFAFENTVRNTGGTPSGVYQAQFFLSTDTLINTSDISMGVSSRDSIAAGGRHQRVSNLRIPDGVSPGNYYVGMRITGNTGTDTAYDPVRIQVTADAFRISAAVNGAWFEPATAGQGLLVEVFPGLGKIFVAWFTFDDPRPAPQAQARLGEPGQRWLTGFGDYSGNRAVLDLANSSGGVFDRTTPSVQTSDGYGTAEIEFNNCNSATLSYTIPSIGRSGSIALQRTAPDSVESCETINATLGEQDATP